MTSSIG